MPAAATSNNQWLDMGLHKRFSEGASMPAWVEALKTNGVINKSNLKFKQTKMASVVVEQQNWVDVKQGAVLIEKGEKLLLKIGANNRVLQSIRLKPTSKDTAFGHKAKTVIRAPLVKKGL